MTSSQRSGVVAVVILILVIGAFGLWRAGLLKLPATGTTPPPDATASTTPTPAPTPTPTAADWKPGSAPVIPDTNALDAGVTAKLSEVTISSLAQAKNLTDVTKAFDITLSPEESSYLLKNHFVLVPLERTTLKNEAGFDEMLSAFDRVTGSFTASNRAPQNAKLVTPDVALHAYHRFFENTLEELEKNELNTALNAYLADLSDILNQKRVAAPGATKPNYERISAQVAVARTLLENHGPAAPGGFDTPDEAQSFAAKDKKADTVANAKKILTNYVKDLPSDLRAKAAAELELIYAADGLSVSPLFGLYSNGKVKGDYTQYTPRSHYTKNSILRAYFRAMMYLGRSSYLASSDDGMADSNLLARAYTARAASGRTPLSSWQRIMGVTTFYAGESDDLTYNEWNDLMQKTIGNTSDEMLSNAQTISKEVAGLPDVRLPRILSDIIVDPNVPNQTKADLLRNSLSFRLFGQRFTYDAWILNDLTGGQEAKETKLPSMPSAVFIPAAMGSQRATEFVRQFLFNDSKFSPSEVDSFVQKALVKKQQQIQAVKNTEWFSSLSSAWVFVLGSLTKTFGAGYPAYMQSSAFVDKELQTFLGSYTELKHDTVLYAKQSYAEMGAGGGEDKPMPPIVKGFVEPNLAFWNKLSALVTYNQQLFSYYDVFKDHPAREVLREFGEDVDFYKNLAHKELNSQQLSDDEYEKLRTKTLSYVAQPFSGGDQADPDAWQTALVTDIHTDGLSNSILYEGTLRPLVMLALIGNENSPRLTVGISFNHVEYTAPIGPRATDEEWRAKVYGNQKGLPPKNFWYQTLQP